MDVQYYQCEACDSKNRWNDRRNWLHVRASCEILDVLEVQLQVARGG
jgi:hypothetical protein